jgi:hypothetical protein
MIGSKLGSSVRWLVRTDVWVVRTHMFRIHMFRTHRFESTWFESIWFRNHRFEPNLLRDGLEDSMDSYDGFEGVRVRRQYGFEGGDGLEAAMDAKLAIDSK